MSCASANNFWVILGRNLVDQIKHKHNRCKTISPRHCLTLFESMFCCWNNVSSLLCCWSNVVYLFCCWHNLESLWCCWIVLNACVSAETVYTRADSPRRNHQVSAAVSCRGWGNLSSTDEGTENQGHICSRFQPRRGRGWCLFWRATSKRCVSDCLKTFCKKLQHDVSASTRDYFISNHNVCWALLHNDTSTCTVL